LFFSRRQQNVRRGAVSFVSATLIVVGVVFSFEIALILMGAGDVFLPMTSAARSFLASLMF